MAGTAIRPLIGWDLRRAAGKVMVLDLHMAAGDEERGAVLDGSMLPVSVTKAMLTPEQCLVLSEELMRQALIIMAQGDHPRAGAAVKALEKASSRDRGGVQR